MHKNSNMAQNVIQNSHKVPLPEFQVISLTNKNLKKDNRMLLRSKKSFERQLTSLCCSDMNCPVKSRKMSNMSLNVTFPLQSKSYTLKITTEQGKHKNGNLVKRGLI